MDAKYRLLTETICSRMQLKLEQEVANIFIKTRKKVKITNKTVSIQEIDFHQLVCMAALCYIDAIGTIY